MALSSDMWQMLFVVMFSLPTEPLKLFGFGNQGMFFNIRHNCPSYTTLLLYLRSPSNVQALLMELKLERWGSIFEGVDGATLSQLQDDDLKENRFLPTVFGCFGLSEMNIGLFEVWMLGMRQRLNDTECICQH